MVNCINLIIEMSSRFILRRENVPCVAEVVNRSLKADCTDFTKYLRKGRLINVFDKAAMETLNLVIVVPLTEVKSFLKWEDAMDVNAFTIDIETTSELDALPKHQ